MKWTFFLASKFTIRGNPAYPGLLYRGYRVRNKIQCNFSTVLEWDGVEISQSMAIARFVAKKAGLAGRNELEQALCDMVVDHVVDLEEKMYGCARSKTDEERKTAGAKLFDGGMQSFNETSAALLKKRGGKFFVGGEMTWADVAMAYALDTLMDPGRFEEIPGQDKRFKEFKLDPVLDDLRKRVNSHPGIKTWLQTRPKGARNI